MKKQDVLSSAKAAILALSEIKAASDAFDRGETNVFDAMDSILAAVEAYRAAAQQRSEAA